VPKMLTVERKFFVKMLTDVCVRVYQSDEDYETYDTVLELDELLNLDTDAERTAYIQVSNLPVLAIYLQQMQRSRAWREFILRMHS